VFLQHPEDLGLRAGTHVADFVQEERAAVRLLETANPLLVGAGKRPLLMAEELGFQQVLLQGRTIHFHEIP
jgi:hypothetical protein